MTLMLPAAMSLLLQTPAPAAPVTQAAPPAVTRPAAEIPVQLGVTLTPDSVTVGQRFIVILRVKAPRGATIQFPQKKDSATADLVTATQMIGTPVVQPVADTSSTSMSAAYRMSAWDTGPQRLGLPDIVVRVNGKTGYVSLADRSVFVRSVLPEDSALRIPKPPRRAFEFKPFNWLPWAFLAAGLLAAGLLWRLWIWYRRRRDMPLAPFEAAEREFDRIVALRLVESGEPERHAALMSDVMRTYLAARVAGIYQSQTSSELLASAGEIHPVAPGLGELLWRTDLVKFAGIRIPPDESEKAGASARAIARAVETHILAKEKNAALQAKAA